MAAFGGGGAQWARLGYLGRCGVGPMATTSYLQAAVQNLNLMAVVGRFTGCLVLGLGLRIVYLLHACLFHVSVPRPSPSSQTFTHSHSSRPQISPPPTSHLSCADHHHPLPHSASIHTSHRLRRTPSTSPSLRLPHRLRPTPCLFLSFIPPNQLALLTLADIPCA